MSQSFLTFGCEPSAMVEREKLSLWSSEGVRNLLQRTEDRRENVSEMIRAKSDKDTVFRQMLQTIASYPLFAGPLRKYFYHLNHDSMFSHTWSAHYTLRR